MASGFFSTKSGVAAMNTGTLSYLSRFMMMVPSPSASAMALYGSTLIMASTVLAAMAAIMLLTSMRTSWKSPFFSPFAGPT